MSGFEFFINGVPVSGGVFSAAFIPIAIFGLLDGINSYKRRLRAERDEEQRRRQEAERAREEAERAREEEGQRREEAERAREDEERRREEAEMAREEEERRRQEAEAARRDEERLRENGIEPEDNRTPEEINTAKAEAGFRPGCKHVAICGSAGSGKSTLTNSLRGLRGLRTTSPNIAGVGVRETTQKISVYLDDRRPNFIWYDVPGAGTPTIPLWRYYDRQKLWIYDYIIVVHDARLTEADINILRNCVKYRQEALIVRSKSDQHINNLAEEQGIDSASAKMEYETSSKAAVRDALAKANLADSPLYMVSRNAVLNLANGGAPLEGQISEHELFTKLGLI